MPGVNFTGGRRNAARQRSRDVTGQKQRDHFQKQRRHAFLKPEAATANQLRATQGPQGPHGINLAHAQHVLRRHPDYDEKSHTNVQSYSIPLAHGILPRSPPPLSSRKRARSIGEQDESEDGAKAFEVVRRRLMTARNLVGLVRHTPKKLPTSSTMSSSPSDQGHSERVVEQTLNNWPVASSSIGSALEQELEPPNKAFLSSASSPNVCASTDHSESGSDGAVIADPWVALQLQTRIELCSERSSPRQRDLTLPEREGFDIPECAGLDFRLARYSLSPDPLLQLRPEDEAAASSKHVQSPIKHTLPFPSALDYFLDGQITSEEEIPAVDALSYWLDDTDDGYDDDTTAHVSIPPATLDEAHAPVKTVLPSRHSHSGIDDILAFFSADPLAQSKSSDSYTIAASSSPGSRVSPLPTAVSGYRLVQRPPLSTRFDSTPTFVNPLPVRGDRPCLPPKDSTLSCSPDQLTDHAGLRTNLDPAVVPHDPSTPLHATIDNIIATAFPSLPCLSVSRDSLPPKPNDIPALDKLSRLERDAVPVSGRAGFELKFSSFWDEDDDKQLYN